MLGRSVIFLFCYLSIGQALDCARRAAENGYICVCNSTYCDNVPPLGDISPENLKVYYTSSDNPGFNVKEVTFSNVQDPDVSAITVNTNTYQKIIGFGGAFTDAASINIKRLSDDLQQKLLESYFADDGLEYNICRVPLGSCDFSPRQYTLDDYDDDWTLEHFELQPEDLNFKIPVIQQALEIKQGKQLYLFASTWTAPIWMKEYPEWYGGARLDPKNFQLFANYTVKFFDEYLNHGIEFWGMTLANEPLTGFYLNNPIPSMGWNIADQVNWLADHLGPSLKNSQHKNLKIMIHDDNAITMPLIVPVFIATDKALEYVDGIATHWYWDPLGSIGWDVVKTDKKELFLLSSESCHFGVVPPLGKWSMATEYLHDIYKDLRLGFAGWVEWNIALNITGGPTHINTPADATIIISEDYTEFYKQPTFYAIGHFSKFIAPDSVRVDVSASDNRIDVLAFLRPDNLKVVVIHNNNNYNIPVQIGDNGRFSEAIDTPAYSLNTIIYNS